MDGVPNGRVFVLNNRFMKLNGQCTINNRRNFFTVSPIIY